MNRTEDKRPDSTGALRLKGELFMTRITDSRPRMAAIYAPGTVRARRWHGEGDVRGYRPPRGWTARADPTDIHPIMGCALRVLCGGSSRRRNERASTAPQSVSSWGGGIKNPGAAVGAPGIEGQLRNQNAIGFALVQAAELKNT